MSKGQHRNLRIMVVDDDIEISKMVEQLSAEYPYTFFVIRNGGHSALKYLDDWAFDVDVVITDLKMTGMGGLRLTTRIREREAKFGRNIKIFWYSGLEFDQSDKYDPHVMVKTECKVEHLYKKPYPVDQLIDDVISRLRCEK